MERAALHQAELLEDWELARQQAPLKPIEPLGWQDADGRR